MGKEFINFEIGAQDSFTAELERAVDRVLNQLSDAELAELLNGEDRTFLNQETPSGQPLAASPVATPKSPAIYSWGNFTIKIKSNAGVPTPAYYHVPSPREAADRQDLALAA